MIKTYTFDVSNLSPTEKEQFFQELDKFAFMIDPEEHERGHFIVAWDYHEELGKVVHIPKNCTFTVI